MGMRDIAEELNISRATVSYVLNGRAQEEKISKEMVEKVLKTAQRHKYIPHLGAQSLVKQKTNTICALFPELSFGWGQSLIEGILPVLDEVNYSLLVGVHMREPRRVSDELLISAKRRDEGVLFCGAAENILSEIKKFLDYSIPCLFVGNILEELPQTNYVSWDVVPAIKVAIKYLASTGRKKIGFIGAGQKFKNSQLRYRAYLDAMRELGLQIDKRWISWEEETVSPAKSIKQFFSLNSNRPDGVLVINDPLAILALDEMGKVGIKAPEDVGVMGLGDIFLASHSGIQLTTIREPVDILGQEAARMILNLIAEPGQKPFHRLVSGNELKIRKTA